MAWPGKTLTEDITVLTPFRQSINFLIVESIQIHVQCIFHLLFPVFVETSFFNLLNVRTRMDLERSNLHAYSPLSTSLWSYPASPLGISCPFNSNSLLLIWCVDGRARTSVGPMPFCLVLMPGNPHYRNPTGAQLTSCAKSTPPAFIASIPLSNKTMFHDLTVGPEIFFSSIASNISTSNPACWDR